MYEVCNGRSLPLMKDIFPINRNLYSLRQNSQFSRPQINSVSRDKNLESLAKNIGSGT